MKLLNNRKFVMVLIGGILIAGILIYLNMESSAVSNGQQVRIAVNVPLTGPIAAWSGQFQNGFEMGIEEACAQNEIDPEIFSVDVQDNQGKPAEAASIFRMQKLKGFGAYVSVATGPANANSAELDAMGIPHFIAAFDPFITKGKADRFRVMANCKIEAPLIIDYIKRSNAKSVYVIQLDMSYAEDEWSGIIVPALEQHGVKVTRERYDIAMRDFKSVAQKAKAEDADIVCVCGYSFLLLPLIQDLRTAGLVKRGRIVSVMDFVDLVYTDTPTEELLDVAFVCPLFDVPEKVAKAADWRVRYKARFNMNPTYVPAYAYDNAALIVKAYAKSKSIGTEALVDVGSFDGINGAIELDSDHDVMATVTLAEINDLRQIVELTD